MAGLLEGKPAYWGLILGAIVAGSIIYGAHYALISKVDDDIVGGIVLAVLMGWEFMAAEFVGGPCVFGQHGGHGEAEIGDHAGKHRVRRGSQAGGTGTDGAEGQGTADHHRGRGEDLRVHLGGPQ